MSVCMGGWLEILQVTIPNTPWGYVVHMLSSLVDNP